MLSQSVLKSLLDYNPKTGNFFWRQKVGNIVAGSLAGSTTKDGYRSITISQKVYYAHRLAFLYIEGYIPEFDIDHIDGNRENNSFSNLRVVSRSCNLQNRKISRRNTSGFTGVSYNKRDKKWQASIRVHGKNFYIGSFDNKIDAALARLACEDNCTNFTCDNICENREKIFSVLRNG